MRRPDHIDENRGAPQRIDDWEEGRHDQNGGLDDRRYFLTDVDHLGFQVNCLRILLPLARAGGRKKFVRQNAAVCGLAVARIESNDGHDDERFA